MIYPKSFQSTLARDSHLRRMNPALCAMKQSLFLSESSLCLSSSFTLCRQLSRAPEKVISITSSPWAPLRGEMTWITEPCSSVSRVMIACISLCLALGSESILGGLEVSFGEFGEFGEFGTEKVESVSGLDMSS